MEQIDYCENCTVVEVQAGDKYCIGCIKDIVDYLAKAFDEQAEEFTEKIAVEKGLY